MKQKLLLILFSAVIILNLVLLWMVFDAPPKKGPQPPQQFLIEEVGFSDEQSLQFRQLDQEHRKAMRAIDGSLKVLKDSLFKALKNPSFNADELTQKMGMLEGAKEKEVFNFFKRVRLLCTKGQLNRFDSVIQEALRKGAPHKPGPSKRGDRERPPRKF